MTGEDSRSSNKDFLVRRIAWKLQALAEGDLSERARQRAAEIASDGDLRTRAPKGFDWSKSGNALLGPGRDHRLPVAGTELRRRYGNREIVVKVLRRG